MAAKWAFHVDIYEASVGADYPVLRHTFFGKTRQETLGYYRAHLKTDTFFKGCVERGRWKDVECGAKAHWEKLRA